MKFHSPDGRTAEIIHLSMTSADSGPRLMNVSDGLWLLIRNPNLTEVARVKFPALLDALAQETPDSPEVTAFLATSLAKYGIDLAKLSGLKCQASPSI